MVFGHAGTKESSPWVLPGLSSPACNSAKLDKRTQTMCVYMLQGLRCRQKSISRYLSLVLHEHMLINGNMQGFAKYRAHLSGNQQPAPPHCQRIWHSNLQLLSMLYSPAHLRHSIEPQRNMSNAACLEPVVRYISSWSGRACNASQKKNGSATWRSQGVIKARATHPPRQRGDSDHRKVLSYC